jgi:hypothetical protein
LDTVHKISEDVAVLQSGSGHHQGSFSSRVGLQADKEIADPPKAAPRRNPAKGYAAVAVSASTHTISPSEEFADRGITLDAASAAPSSKVSTVKETLMAFKNCYLQTEDNH